MGKLDFCLLQRNLEDALIDVTSAIKACIEPETKACLVILEEDLEDLLMECEEHMVLSSANHRFEVEGFINRSETVLEETKDLLGSISSCKGDDLLIRA